jgi:hypothetical protein
MGGKSTEASNLVAASSRERREERPSDGRPSVGRRGCNVTAFSQTLKANCVESAHVFSVHAKTMAAWLGLEALALDPRRSETPLRPSLYVPVVRQLKAYLNRCGLPDEVLFPPPYLAAHHNELADRQGRKEL